MTKKLLSEKTAVFKDDLLTGQNFRLHNALAVIDPVQHGLQGHGQIHSFGGNGDNGGAVGGDDGIDGQDIGLGSCKDAQNFREQARLVVEQQLMVMIRPVIIFWKGSTASRYL